MRLCAGALALRIWKGGFYAVCFTLSFASSGRASLPLLSEILLKKDRLYNFSGGLCPPRSPLLLPGGYRFAHNLSPSTSLRIRLLHLRRAAPRPQYVHTALRCFGRMAQSGANAMRKRFLCFATAQSCFPLPRAAARALCRVPYCLFRFVGQGKPAAPQRNFIKKRQAI